MGIIFVGQYHCIQSCKMSNCVHRSNISNQTLPQERRKNRHNFNAQIEEKNQTYCYFWGGGGGLVGSHRSPQINQFLNKTLLKFVEFTPKLLHFHKSAWSPKMFTPTFHYFYTDISAISVKYWIFVHISCHSLHHSNVYVLRGITAFSLLCFAHNPGKMAISLMPYQDQFIKLNQQIFSAEKVFTFW